MPTFVKRATSADELEALKAKVRSPSYHFRQERFEYFPNTSLTIQALKKPISLLFTSAAVVTPLYKALSSDFHKTLDFYAAREVKVGVEAMEAFGVKKTPAVVVLYGDEITVYEGEQSRLSLLQKMKADELVSVVFVRISQVR